MANQESGKIKQLKLRLPMEVFRQLEIDAERHNDKPATRARHILGDALMTIDVSTPEEQMRIKRMIDANWEKINSRKGENK